MTVAGARRPAAGPEPTPVAPHQTGGAHQTTARRRTAAGLACAGASLGVVAGITQASAGSHLAGWAGNKSNPVPLGLLTIVLSLVALAVGMRLRRPAPLDPSRRVVFLLGLLVPAGLCFSTVGALWYLPGVVLLGAAGFTLAAGGTEELRAVISADWNRALISVLGGFEILMAVSAAPAEIIAIGIIGGVALMAAPWMAGRSRLATLALLVIGTVPFAVLTWWSVASPLVAIIALAIGLPASRARPTRPAAGARGPHRRTAAA